MKNFLILSVLVVLGLTVPMLSQDYRLWVCKISQGNVCFISLQVTDVAGLIEENKQNEQKEDTGTLQTFKFSDFNSSDVLEQYLREQTLKGESFKIEGLEELLIEQGLAETTDNLINYRQTGLLTRGSSSEDNYRFYFKPTDADDWKTASQGWVIKAIYRNLHGGPDEIFVLTSPTNKSEEAQQAIQLVKELINYKEQLIPKTPDKNTPIAELMKIHDQSECLENLNPTCLLNEALKFIDTQNSLEQHELLKRLADITIDVSSAKTAKELLIIWPSADRIKSYWESFPKRRKQDEKYIDLKSAEIAAYEAKLLLVAGDYQAAEQKLQIIQDTWKAGIDYGALSALEAKGDIDYALQLAEKIHKWERTYPDPNENSSGLGHCNNYNQPPPRALAYGALSKHALKVQDLPKAERFAQLAKDYWEQKAYGQRSYCYKNFARHSYLTATERLVKYYFENGNQEQAEKLFEELYSVLEAQTEEVNSWDRSAYRLVFDLAYEIEHQEFLISAFDNFESKNNIKFAAMYTNDYDPVVFMLAYNDKKEKVIKLLAEKTYQTRSDDEQEIPSFLSVPRASDNSIRFSTLIELAETFLKYKRYEDASFYAKHVEKYLGHRKDDFDNIEDLFHLARIHMELGDQEEAERLYQLGVDEFDKHASQLRKGTATQSVLGYIGALTAELKGLEAFHEWERKVPIKMSGWSYAMVGKHLIQNGKWDQYETIKPRLVEVFLEDENVLNNWNRLFFALRSSDKPKLFEELVLALLEEANAQENKFYDAAGRITRKKNWVAQFALGEAVRGYSFTPSTLQRIWHLKGESCLNAEHKDVVKLPEGRFYQSNDVVLGRCYLGVIGSGLQNKQYEERWKL